MLKQNLLICCICFSLFLTGCSSNNPVKPTEQTALSIKNAAIPHQKSINTIFELLDQQQFTAADETIQALLDLPLNNEELLLVEALRAKKLNMLDQAEEALKLLSSADFMEQQITSQRSTQAKIQSVKIQSFTLLNQYTDAAQLRIYMAANLANDRELQENAKEIWGNINQLDEISLNDELIKAHSKTYQQWLLLNKLFRFNKQSLNKQIANIESWQHQYPTHTAALIPPEDITVLRIAAKQRPHKIAVILPFDGKYKTYSNAIRNGLMQSYYQSDYQPLLSFYSVDQQQDFIDVYQMAISEGAELIVGPIFKKQLKELYILESLPVPTIGLNKLSQAINKPDNLIEFSLATEDEIDTMIEQLHFTGFNNALIFSEDSTWAKEDSEYFSDQWQKKEGIILAQEEFSSNKNQSAQLQKLLNIDKSKYRIHRLNRDLKTAFKTEPRRRQDADFIYLLAKPDKASSIKPMLKFHYASSLPSYASSSIYRGYANKSLDHDLNGITFTELPWLISPPANIDPQYRHSPLLRMYAFGVDAFQLAERLNLLKSNSHLSLNGASGKLQLINNKLHRQTSMAAFSKGNIKKSSLLSTTTEKKSRHHGQ